MKTFKYLIINYIFFLSFAFSQDVNLQITNYSDSTIELYMENSVPVAGIQFNIESFNIFQQYRFLLKTY